MLQTGIENSIVLNACHKHCLWVPTLRVRNSLAVSMWRSCCPSSFLLWPHKIEQSTSGSALCTDFFFSPHHTRQHLSGQIHLVNNTGKWMLGPVTAAEKESSRAPPLEDHSEQNSPSGHSFLMTISLRSVQALKLIHGQLLAVSLYCLSKFHHLLPLCPRWPLCTQLPECHFLGSNIT